MFTGGAGFWFFFFSQSNKRTLWLGTMAWDWDPWDPMTLWLGTSWPENQRKNGNFPNENKQKTKNGTFPQNLKIKKNNKIGKKLKIGKISYFYPLWGAYW